MTKLELLSRIVLNDSKYLPHVSDPDTGYLIITGNDALSFIRAAFPALYLRALCEKRAEYYEAEKEDETDDLV